MIQPLGMGAGGNLGDHTAEIGMQRHLPFNNRGQNLRRRTRHMAHHGGGGVVAA